MKWELRVAKSAKKNLKRFPKNDGERIAFSLCEITDNPYNGDLEKITDEINMWRRRVGNYRIIYEIDGKSKTITIMDIRRRTSTTY
ncbi:type II toxin-antitoxin system RelE/ParE family toxin [Patescibacteria group bacterium]|nr:type II toxin-antitoxin system RelE/ParE family toxin [Patescibacteria group bacterium]MBU2218940.1 type II toxin-antitoxin system RelE/ParE family toxin [Patescibacteria group bacterium]MBU2263660.1 type II toxin-antitoxin system RelE/ParE family toxin [Patescibacteria group bacterium]